MDPWMQGKERGTSTVFNRGRIINVHRLGSSTLSFRYPPTVITQYIEDLHGTSSGVIRRCGDLASYLQIAILLPFRPHHSRIRIHPAIQHL